MNVCPSCGQKVEAKLRLGYPSPVTITYKGKMAKVRKTEHKFVQALDCKRTISKVQLLNKVYGAAHNKCENIIEVYISMLRPKLEPLGLKIIYERGIGYRLYFPGELDGHSA